MMTDANSNTYDSAKLVIHVTFGDKKGDDLEIERMNYMTLLKTYYKQICLRFH